jgi:hypothetical protein
MTQFDEEQTQSSPTAQMSQSGVEEGPKIQRKNIVEDISHKK